MTTNPAEKLHDLMEDFRDAMLVTRSASGQLRSRPMALAKVAADGALWLVTERRSGKLDEIASDPHVNVAMQSSSKFLSISGIASPIEDRAKVAELWSEAWKVWFPGGKEDPNLVLLKIEPDAGEYWDNSGVNGVKYLIEAGKAYVSGSRPDAVGDPAMHGKVSL